MSCDIRVTPPTLLLSALSTSGEKKPQSHEHTHTYKIIRQSMPRVIRAKLPRHSLVLADRSY